MKGQDLYTKRMEKLLGFEGVYVAHGFCGPQGVESQVSVYLQKENTVHPFVLLDITEDVGNII